MLPLNAELSSIKDLFNQYLQDFPEIRYFSETFVNSLPAPFLTLQFGKGNKRTDVHTIPAIVSERNIFPNAFRSCVRILF